MKSTTNVFLDGLITDRHPLSTPQNCLTDALNATLLTYNGNEMMLLNDMGNTRILDSATGNIMGLSPGFIPVGMKEHGGIMYIASVNKEGEGEIGTIPSPIIRDFYKDKQLILFTDTKLSVNSYVSISNKIYPSDKLIINLGLKVDPNSIIGDLFTTDNEPLTNLSESIDPCDYYIKRECLLAADYNTTIDITCPILSYSPDVDSDLSYNDGIYRIKLSSKSIANVSAEASDTLYNSYSNSNYWFLHENSISDIFPKDLFEATLNKNLKTFPTSSKPGYLLIKLEKEGIEEFGMLERAVSPHNTPYTVKLNDDEYETYFPGFYYSTNSGIYVDNILCSILNELSGELIPIITQFDSDGSTVANFDFKKIKLESSPETVPVTGFDRDDTNGIQILKNVNKDGYPQWNVKDSNRFLLTNLCDVEDIRTRYKSTTVYDGVPLLSYSGLFKIKLNKDSINQWYRLQVVYKNEYDELLGKSEYRFNPYLNDTFGSNVFLTNIVCSEGLTMGNDEIIPRKQWSINQNVDFYYKTDRPITSKMENPWLENDSINNSKYDSFVKGLHENTGVIATYHEYADYLSRMPFVPKYTYTGNYTFLIDLYDQGNPKEDILKSVNFQNVLYLYGYPILNKTCSISYDEGSLSFEPSGIINCHSFIYSTYRFNLDDCHTYNFNAGDCPVVEIWRYDKTPTLFQSKNFRLIMSNGEYQDFECEDYINWTTRELYSIDDKNNFQPTFSKAKINVTDNTSILKLEKYTDHNFTNDDLSKGSISLPHSLCPSVGLSFTDFYVSGWHDDTWWINMALWREAHNTAITYSIQEQTDELSSDEDVYLSLKLTVPVTALFKISLVTLKPLYKITPHFELQCGNEYVSKIHLTDDIFYKCNLTLGEDQEVLNYLSVTETDPLYSENVFSYIIPEYIEQTTFNYSLNLDLGVYVFNMSAPSTENLYSGFSAGVYPEVNIRVGKNTATVLPYRWAGSSLKARKMKGYGISHGHFWPIVIIVPQADKVTIEIPLDSEKQLSIRYLDIGIYKLNAADIYDNISFEECAYLLPEYLLLITELAKQKFADDQAKATEFKGNYCIFFRQAYSYIEGTYNKSEDVINQITVRTTPYPLAPFVPKEPYILNFMWDRTLDKSEDSSVNASALCGYCQPDAVLNHIEPNTNLKSLPSIPGINRFDTRKDQLFRFFPGGFSDNERPDDYVPQSHLTQLLLLVLDDAKIMCEPAENTLLIKSVLQ